MTDRKIYRQTICIALCLLLLLSQAGCTIMGAAMGAGKDGKNPKQVPYEKSKLKSAKPGLKFKLYLFDGQVIAGEYMGLARISEEGYAKSLNQEESRLLQQINFPTPDTPVIITRNNGHQFSAFLTSINYDSLTVRVPGDSLTYVLPLKTVTSVTCPEIEDGAIFDREMLQQLIEDHELPRSTLLLLKTSSGFVAKVPLDNINQVHLLKRGVGNLFAGMVIGAAVDCLILLALMAAALSNISYGGCG